MILIVLKCNNFETTTIYKMKKSNLQPHEFNNYYQKYIKLLNENIDLILELEHDKKQTLNFFSSISTCKLEFRYQPKKWTIKEVFQHIIDTERVFIFRCFTIARGDKSKLPSFDENAYVLASKANRKTIQELLFEFSTTRDFTISIIKKLSENELKEVGNANNSMLSARACIYIILGHKLWHTNIIKERYL